MLRQLPPSPLPLGERSGGGDWEFAASEKRASLSRPPEKVTFVNFMSRKGNVFTAGSGRKGKNPFLSMFHSCVTRQKVCEDEEMDFFPFSDPSFPSFTVHLTPPTKTMLMPCRNQLDLIRKEAAAGGKKKKEGIHSVCNRIRVIPRIRKQYAGHNSRIYKSLSPLSQPCGCQRLK